MKQKAIFLDRDGVINEAVIKNRKPYPPISLNELKIPVDVPKALADLKAKGFMLIGATNQPDVARGTASKEIVEAMNASLMKQLPLDAIYVCYHDDQDQCECRKPLPGLMLQASNDHNIDLTNSIMIGDRWKDIEAGQRAGCRTIWLNHQYDEKSPSRMPDCIVSCMTEAVNWIQMNT